MSLHLRVRVNEVVRFMVGLSYGSHRIHKFPEWCGEDRGQSRTVSVRYPIQGETHVAFW